MILYNEDFSGQFWKNALKNHHFFTVGGENLFVSMSHSSCKPSV